MPSLYGIDSLARVHPMKHKETNVAFLGVLPPPETGRTSVTRKIVAVLSECYNANKQITKTGTIKAVKQSLGFSDGVTKWDNDIWQFARDLTQEVIYESTIESYLIKVREAGRKITRTSLLEFVKQALNIDLIDKIMSFIYKM